MEQDEVKVYSNHADVPTPFSTFYDRIYIFLGDGNLYARKSDGTFYALSSGGTITGAINEGGGAIEIFDAANSTATDLAFRTLIAGSAISLQNLGEVDCNGMTTEEAAAEEAIIQLQITSKQGQ